MKSWRAKTLKMIVLVSLLVGLYLLALQKHAERDSLRLAAVELTPACKAKLVDQYALQPDDVYRSPYLLKTEGRAPTRRGYSEEDVRAIQRGCNIVDDMQGQQARTGARAR